jgi:hypothetical protein
MIENNPIKKMVSSILRNRKKALFDRNIMHPEREWFLGVFLGLVILCIGIAWSVSTYMQFKNVSLTSLSTEEENVVYRQSLVDTALADFEVRKKSYEDLKKQLLGKYKKSIEVVAPPVVSTENSSSTENTVVEEPLVASPEETSPVEEGGEIKFE